MEDESRTDAKYTAIRLEKLVSQTHPTRTGAGVVPVIEFFRAL